MKSPLSTFRNWARRKHEQARARGALHLFWFHLSMGLIWSLFVLVTTTAFDYYREGVFDAEDWQRRALFSFISGLFFGIVMWVTQEAPGTGRRDLRR